MPHLQQGAKVIEKKALQTGVNVAQDVLDGDARHLGPVFYTLYSFYYRLLT